MQSFSKDLKGLLKTLESKQHEKAENAADSQI